MKVKRGIHEVLSFIMFNWIAFYLSNYVVNLEGIHKSGSEATNDVLASARILFPQSVIDALGCSAANWGIVMAIVAAIIIWVIIEKTTLGFKLKAVGFNDSAALYAGINSDRSVLTALGISGALAGLGGAVQILGMAGRLSQFAGQEGFGFEGITVALIGSSSPIGCIFSGIFYGAMKYGGSKLSIVKAPSEVVDIIMGCIVLSIAISQVYKALFLKIGKKKKEV
jgi:simple sugar transport system permease protein